MKIKKGNGTTEYGPGVSIELKKGEVAAAIVHWLHGQGVYVSGPKTVTVGGELCEKGHVYVDPSGFVMHKGKRWNGRGGRDG